MRGEQWRIADLRAFGPYNLLTLVNAAGSRRVITPFDLVEPIAESRRARRVGMRCWRRACLRALASAAPPGTLRTAVRARIDLLPHQLAPALAVVRGHGCRLLLADDVGLGKTIQAGLVVAELLARRSIERVLVLTPSGVRDQWGDELRARFGIEAALADARSLRQLAGDLPVGVNPWTTLPIAIASVDYVKRPEVLPAVGSIRWDVVVVDEAHGAAGLSDRYDAVRTLTARAPYVVLLTATPHSGDERAFAALCALGSVASEAAPDRLLLFRRTRRMVLGDETRRVRAIQVRPSAPERRMHVALSQYIHAVRTEHGDRALALSVLEKRAFSSPWSLEQSVQRRLRSLAGYPDPDTAYQPSLPLLDDAGDGTDDDAPPLWPDLALADTNLERRLLTGVLACARDAAGRQSKLAALLRFLRRVREPALVFTEYRDTATHLHSRAPQPALLLHGGMDRATRAAVVDDFCRGACQVLIATDAAGQGLNLHRTCRLVVNVELPWNPMRLEQRIGRVDRIGQTRIVHAVHLVARDTREAGIRTRLQALVTFARETLDVPDPVGGAAAAIASRPAPAFSVADLDDACVAEASRLRSLRPLARGPADGRMGEFPGLRALIARTRRRRLRAALDGAALAICRIASADGLGGVAESTLCGLLVHGGANRALHPGELIPRTFMDDWRRQVAAVSEPYWSTRLARERAIADAGSAADLSLFQPTLFDRRAERAHASEYANCRERARDEAERLRTLERLAAIGEPSVALLLMVLPR